MELMGFNVYWTKNGADEEKCTFIMAPNHETACTKVQQIKGSDIQVIRSQTYDRVEKCFTGDPVYYTRQSMPLA